MKKHTFIVERTRTGYSAYCASLSAATTGRNFPELKQNMLDAANSMLEHRGEAEITEKSLTAKLDLQQFFDFYKVINARGLAERIKMNETLLNQYIKGKKAPSPKQVQRILHGVRDLGKELTQLEIA